MTTMASTASPPTADASGTLPCASLRDGDDAGLDHAPEILTNPPDSGESGQGMVEYALILSLIVVVVILMVTLLGHQTQNLYSNISSSLGT